MILYDGKKKIKIEIREGNNLDWSNDFFAVPYDIDGNGIVKDVDYCIEEAYDWKNRTGDFAMEEGTEEREVYVEEL